MAEETLRATLGDGTSMPVIGLGTYRAGGGAAEEAVMQAVDAGYRHIDTAPFFGNEREVGRAVAAKIGEGAVTREDMYLSSKLWNTDHRPDLVEAACRRTLADLGTDYLDLYLMHFPTAFKAGGEPVPRGADGQVLFDDVDFVDTYQAMEALVDKGLVRSIGVSNFNSAQLRRLLANCNVRPVVNQVEVHPRRTQEALVNLCQVHDVQVVAHSPLAAGGLLGHADVAVLARAHGKTPAQVLLRYLFQRGVIPVPKTVTRSRMDENLDIFDFELSTDEVDELDSLNEDAAVFTFPEAVGHPEYPFDAE